MNGLRRWHVLLFLAIAVTLFLQPAAPATGQSKPTPTRPSAPSSGLDVQAISQELQSMHKAGLFKGGNDQVFASAEEATRRLPTSPAQVKPVVFDTARARRLGFSYTSIAIGQQLAALSNDIVANAASAERAGASAKASALKFDLTKYPMLQQFFTSLNRSHRSAAPSANSNPRPTGLGGRAICGWFTNPRPSSAKHATMFFNQSDPAETLRRWGYHETPGWAGGGWTRAQTYRWWACGWGTFRDHAWIDGTTINEQNYDGWTPRGEPNPEFWRTGPWPYAEWPAYVAWWHDKN